MFRRVPCTAVGPEQIKTDFNAKTCKLSCCFSCSFCNRATTKERPKSRFVRCNFQKVSIKVCQKCIFCHSIVLCHSCNKCHTCCTKSNCRGQTSEILANLAGSGCRSKSSTDLERGLHPPLLDQTESFPVPHCRKFVRQSPQEQLPVGGIAAAYRQKRCRTSSKSNISRFFQPALLGAKTQQQMEADIRSKQSQYLPKSGQIQDGDTRNHQNIPPARGVGNLGRLQRCLLPHTNTGTIQEISEISCPGSDIPVQGPPIWSVHSTHGVHCGSKRGKIDGNSQGYKDPPVPRRLVGQSHIPSYLSPTYTDPSQDLPGPRLAGECREIRTGTQTGIRLRRLPVRPQVRPGPTDTGPVAEPSRENKDTLITTGLSGPAAYVPDRPTNSHRKTGSPWPVTHETHTVAPQKQLEDTRIFRKGYPSTHVLAPPPTMVAGGRQCAPRTSLTPFTTRSADIYRRIKRRVGRSLKRAHCKRPLVGAGKQSAHKLSGTESSIPSLKRIPRSLYRKDSSSGNRQHHSGGIYKQGRRHEARPSMCPTVENLDLVFPETSDCKSPPHSRSSQCDSGQVIQTGSDHPDRVVPPPRDLSEDMQQMAPASNRSLCNEIQPQVTSVCISSTGPPGYSSGCTHSTMGGPGCLCLPTYSHLGQSGGETTGLPLSETHSDRSGVAQHALVLGLSSSVQPDSSQPAKPAQSVDAALQSDPSHEPVKSKSPCLAPRATAIKEQGFSEAVAARIEAPQRRSTRSVYEAKWAVFTKWCISHQVDFRSPPLKSVADFLMHLFEDRKLQLSTIDGYRSAIADKLGSTMLDISKDNNLTRLLESFHRDRPKGRRGIPSWNLSLVLHQLTKAPFEPLKGACLKHLTFKTVFLLALGSGKRRSEIHAWQHKNIRHRSDWSKVSLFPSPSFLSKNQLAKEGPNSVAPVVKPALAPTLDKSLKSDRSLCPIRALRYYLDRTSDIRHGKELVFVSFKKGFDQDITPATISSWIKQTVILCYELSDHQDHTLHQVKAHDVRAFAASKAFQSGMSLEQILSACHWKSHNTFTQFYLKDVAWADPELYHLGPVVAAQQIHQQTSA